MQLVLHLGSISLKHAERVCKLTTFGHLTFELLRGPDYAPQTFYRGYLSGIPETHPLYGRSLEELEQLLLDHQIDRPQDFTWSGMNRDTGLWKFGWDGPWLPTLTSAESAEHTVWEICIQMLEALNALALRLQQPVVDPYTLPPDDLMPELGGDLAA